MLRCIFEEVVRKPADEFDELDEHYMIVLKLAVSGFVYHGHFAHVECHVDHFVRNVPVVVQVLILAADPTMLVYVFSLYHVLLEEKNDLI